MVKLEKHESRIELASLISNEDEDLEIDYARVPSKRKSGIILQYFCLFLVILFVTVVGIYGERRLKSSKMVEEECRDPYREVGYISRSSEASSIRWIPYSSSQTNSNRSSIPDSHTLPTSALAQAAPSYTTQLLNESEHSHDRSNVASFCSQHPGTVHEIPGFHLKSNCRLKDLNFTVASWFHYGMAEESESWYMRSEDGPYGIENRLNMLYKEDIESGNIGRPDLIILNSFYWDLRYFALHSEHYKTSTGNQEERFATWGELEWHRSRLVTFVTEIRKLFPETEIMFRLGQAHATSRNNGNVAVSQMNQSIRFIMAQLNVPILEWATLIAGETQYLDDQHLKDGAASFLLSNMVLFYLKRALTSECLPSLGAT